MMLCQRTQTGITTCVDMAQRLARECLDSVTPPPVRSLAADGNHHCLFLGVDSFPRVQAGSRAFGYNCTGSRQRYRRGQSTFDGRFRSGGCSLRFVGVEEIASDVLHAYFNLPLYFVWYSSAVFSKISLRTSAHTRMGLYQASRAFVTIAIAVAATQLLCHGFHDRIVFSWLFVAASGVLLLLSGWVGARSWMPEISRDRRHVVMSASAASAIAALAFAALAPYYIPYRAKC